MNKYILLILYKDKDNIESGQGPIKSLIKKRKKMEINMIILVSPTNHLLL